MSAHQFTRHAPVSSTGVAFQRGARAVLGHHKPDGKAVVTQRRYDQAIQEAAERAKPTAAEIQASLDSEVLHGHPASVSTVYAWGLAHPGGCSTASIVESTGLSERTAKTANRTLVDLKLAVKRERMTRGGRVVEWRYVPSIVDLGIGQLCDLGIGQERDHEPAEVARCHDRVVPPTTCGNVRNGVGSSVSTTTGEVRGRMSSDRELPSSTSPVVAVRAAFDAAIEARGFHVMASQRALVDYHLLTMATNDLDDALAFVAYVTDTGRSGCKAPYLAKTIEEYATNWTQSSIARRAATSDEELRLAMQRTKKPLAAQIVLEELDDLWAPKDTTPTVAAPEKPTEPQPSTVDDSSCQRIKAIKVVLAEMRSKHPTPVVYVDPYDDQSPIGM